MTAIADLLALNAQKAALYASLTQSLLADEVAHDADLKTHPDVLAYVEFKDMATVNADLGRSNWSDAAHRPWSAVPFTMTPPTFDVENGLAYMRFAGGDVNQRLLAAQLFCPQGTRHAFCRYVLVIEPDVPQFMTELGVKLPGFAGEYEDTVLHPPHAGTKTFSWRMEHGPKTDLAVRDYLYDGATGSSFGSIKDYGSVFPVGVPITIEQELDVDAGLGNVWVNGALVGTRAVIADVDIEELFLNVYHGGTGKSTAPIHYRIAAACIATRRIGVPKEITMATPTDDTYAVASGSDLYVGQSGVPSWVSALPLMQWYTFPNSQFNQTPTMIALGATQAKSLFAYSGGTVKNATSELVIFGGGHTDGWRNEGWSFQMGLETPAWVRLRDSTPFANIGWLQSDVGNAHYSDGRRASAHSYWCIQFNQPLNRVMFMGACAVYGNGNGGFGVMDAFDMATGDYLPANTYPGSVPGSVATPIAADLVGNIYAHTAGITNTNHIIRWSPTPGSPDGTPGAITDLGAHGAAFNEHSYCVDTKRNIFVRLGDTNTPVPAAFYDLDAGGSETQFTMAGDATAIAEIRGAQGGQGRGQLVYDTANDCLWFWRRVLSADAPAIYRVDMTGTKPSLTFTASKPAMTGTVTNASDNYSSAYGRFAYVPNLRGVVWCQASDQPVRFMRTA